MQSAQYLISNPIEEKSNRISEVLLASVTLGELMMPVIMIQLIPLAMVVFVVRDPDNTIVRIMSWFPLFTSYLMINCPTADHPLIDVVGTTIV